MESSIGMSAGQDTMSSPGLTSQVVSSSPEREVSNTPAVNERSFTQSELNEVVKKAKRDAAESERRRIQQATEIPRDDSSNYQSQGSQAQNSFNEDHYRKIAAEEAQRMRDVWLNESRQKQETEYAQKIANNFWSKISTGKEKYQDFDSVTGNIEYQAFPNTVQILSEYIDNAQDVLYELGKDRFKMAQLETLSRLSPNDAIIQAQRLAQSIKDNEQAAKVRLANEPLSQMRPSITGTSNTQMTMRDLKSKYRV